MDEFERGVVSDECLIAGVMIRQSLVRLASIFYCLLKESTFTLLADMGTYIGAEAGSPTLLTE